MHKLLAVSTLIVALLVGCSSEPAAVDQPKSELSELSTAELETSLEEFRARLGDYHEDSARVEMYSKLISKTEEELGRRD